jgi:hypothetical protein
MRILAKQYPGNVYTLIHAGGFIANQEPEFDCLAKLEALGLSEDEAIDVLYAKAVPAEWRSLFGQAAAAEAVAVAAAVSKAASEEDVKALSENTAALQASIQELQADQKRRDLETERRDLESFLDAEAQKCRDALAASGQRNTRFSENLIWEQLWATPAGQRLQEVRAA